MKTALLVIDMQEFFRPMVTKSLANVVKLCSYFTRSSMPVVFTQHGHSQQELTTVPSPNQLVRKWGPEGSIATGSPDWELLPELSKFLPEAGAQSGQFPRRVAKNTYDAFLNSDMARILESTHIERVVVCGVMTDCCCDTTARSAFNRGYETWLVHDACGSANKTQHEAGLRGFEFAFGEVLGTDQVMSRLDQDRDGS